MTAGQAGTGVSGEIPQPAALYLTTIGLSYDLALGAGSRLDLQ